MNVREAKLALNARRFELHLARVKLREAIRDVERVVYRKDQPALTRRQAG